ncbi:pantoate kinase [Methanocaldococcus indicus]|uniref:pantoate kinase n=1 Tax=Methanocaldococcus indicus TaxID=213231 RepID=UPI003C6D427E
MIIPAHITGFFTIHKEKIPIKSGSTGAGITLDKGVEIRLEDGTGKIYYNDKRADICPVKKILKEETENIFDVYFYSPFPLGSGLGMSGACSLALTKILKLPIEKAHIAEVECNTGLGDVIAQAIKGFVIRLSPGFPTVVKRVPVRVEDYYIVLEILGEKETKDILTNPELTKRINLSGDLCLDELLLNPTLENFIKLSYRFANETNLIDDEIKEICEDLNKICLGASQSMLGKTVFCIVKKGQLKDVLSILKNPIVCKISQ